MLITAKIFKTGNSQVVRLPKTCRLPGDEVWLYKDAITGVVTLTPKKNSSSKLDALFKLIKAARVPNEFMTERDNGFSESNLPTF